MATLNAPAHRRAMVNRRNDLWSDDYWDGFDEGGGGGGWPLVFF